jgi:hypothetical protein
VIAGSVELFRGFFRVKRLISFLPASLDWTQSPVFVFLRAKFFCFAIFVNGLVQLAVLNWVNTSRMDARDVTCGELLLFAM